MKKLLSENSLTTDKNHNLTADPIIYIYISHSIAIHVSHNSISISIINSFSSGLLLNTPV